MPQISFPCPDKTWESLEEREDGSRFCDLCMKKVLTKSTGTSVYCGVDDGGKEMSYSTFLARFAVILLFCFGPSLFTNVQAQTEDTVEIKVESLQEYGSIVGMVRDKETKEGLMFTAIELRNDTTILQRVMNDYDGKFSFAVVPPGTYNLRIRCIGYKELLLKNVKVHVNQISPIDVVIEEDGFGFIGMILPHPEMYNKDPYEIGKTTYDNKKIQQLPYR